MKRAISTFVAVTTVFGAAGFTAWAAPLNEDTTQTTASSTATATATPLPTTTASDGPTHFTTADRDETETSSNPCLATPATVDTAASVTSTTTTGSTLATASSTSATVTTAATGDETTAEQDSESESHGGRVRSCIQTLRDEGVHGREFGKAVSEVARQHGQEQREVDQSAKEQREADRSGDGRVRPPTATATAQSTGTPRTVTQSTKADDDSRSANRDGDHDKGDDRGNSGGSGGNSGRGGGKP